MKYHQLGSSELTVSEICLGTMTWGIQNTQKDADEQMGIALDAGINVLDTAEMYPVPPNAPTYADTERCIGDWLSRNQQKRRDLIVMTKIAGGGIDWIRNGKNITGETILPAIEASLTRLNTDVIDVYQLHWPNRTSPHFGKQWVGMTNPEHLDKTTEIEEMRSIVLALGEAIEKGKIRYWGLSDDTPWGIHTFLKLCEETGVPRPVSIQNEFNLLHAKDWPYLIEMCHLEDIAYLPWSPLATGMLSGKYQNGARPEGSRWTYVQRQGLFRDTPLAREATNEYMKIAKGAGITPSQLALAWCQQGPGVTSTIIGATSTVQLKENIEAFSITLSAETLQSVDETMRRYPIAF